MTQNRFAAGAAYIDGRYMPIAEAAIPMTHWGYRRSDVTYDVVSVHGGNFFRLDDHINRFRASMDTLRMKPRESDDEIKQILDRLVRLGGLKASYVAMDCLRSVPLPGLPRLPINTPSYIAAFAVPWVNVVSDEMYERGVHMIIAKDTRRIPVDSVEPRVKNFHWGDLTRGQFEAADRGADFAVLLDHDGNITEGAGYNVFSITNGKVATPIRGALDGITRKSVIELCGMLDIPCEVRTVSAEEFCDADEIFMCTTAGGIMPVSRIDGRIMGNDRPGAMSSKLKEAFWAERARGWHATPIDYSRVDDLAAA